MFPSHPFSLLKLPLLIYLLYWKLISCFFHDQGEVAELQKRKVILSSSSLRSNQSIVGDRGQLASSLLTSKWTHKCNCTGKYENISSLEKELSVDSGTFFYGTNNDIVSVL